MIDSKKIGAFLGIFSCISMAFAEDTKVNPQAEVEFKAYVHEERNTSLKNLQEDKDILTKLSNKPFILSNQEVSPEFKDLISDMLDAWVPPTCASSPASKSMPKLTISGEFHSCPNCQIDRERNVRDALKNEILLAHEGFEKNDEAQVGELFENSWLKQGSLQAEPEAGKGSLLNRFQFMAKAIKKAVAGGATIPVAPGAWMKARLYGLESEEIRNLANALKATTIFALAAKEQPESLKSNFTLQEILKGNNDPEDIRIMEDFYEQSAQSLAVLFTQDTPETQKTLAAIAQLSANDDLLRRINAARLAAFTNHISKKQSATYAAKVAQEFKGSEVAVMIKALAHTLLDSCKAQLNTYFANPALAKRIFDYMSKKFESGTPEDFLELNDLVESHLRSFDMANNLINLACSNANSSKPMPILARMGLLHAREMEYLFKKSVNSIPYEFKLENLNHVEATEEQTLKNLEAFKKGN